MSVCTNCREKARRILTAVPLCYKQCPLAVQILTDAPQLDEADCRALEQFLHNRPREPDLVNQLPHYLLVAYVQAMNLLGENPA